MTTKFDESIKSVISESSSLRTIYFSFAYDQPKKKLHVVSSIRRGVPATSNITVSDLISDAHDLDKHNIEFKEWLLEDHPYIKVDLFTYHGNATLEDFTEVGTNIATALQTKMIFSNVTNEVVVNKAGEKFGTAIKI